MCVVVAVQQVSLHPLSRPVSAVVGIPVGSEAGCCDHSVWPASGRKDSPDDSGIYRGWICRHLLVVLERTSHWANVVSSLLLMNHDLK